MGIGSTAEGRTAYPVQECEDHVHDVLDLPHHLALGDPESDLCNGDNKIMDLDAIKLCNGNLDVVVEGWDKLLLHSTSRLVT